jgi:hypothetical protein
MNENSKGNGISPAHAGTLARALVVAGFLLCAFNTLAQTLPTYNSGGPTNVYLESWSFMDTTNWTDDDGYPPISFTNLDHSSLGDFHSAVIDTNVPAWLQYNILYSDWTNLTVDAGSLTFWFAPGSWSSPNGTGEYARLFEVGSYTPDSSYGWWSVFVDPTGSTLYFAAQANDLSSNLTTYISYPISWTNNYFHFLAFTYCATNTAFYLDGVWATNGPGMTVYPGSNVLANGFWLGSSSNGLNQAHGMFDTVQTFGYPLNSNDVNQLFNWYYPNYVINPYNAPMFSANGNAVVISSTNLSLWPFNISNNLANLFIVNSGADILYELQGTTNLAHPHWISEGFVDGSELTNMTGASLLVGKTGTLFLRIRSWQDSNNSGIPDWWWLQYFGQITNVDANAADPAGDGFSNLQKFQMGLNPTNYYNPNPLGGFFGCLDASGTNAFLEWSNAPGPVINYAIQRGIQDTNGNYSYTQIGLVSSNANFFEDVGAITNANAQNNVYNLEAVYPGGSVSATNSWTVWWYPNWGSYGPPYGPPMPGNLWANADATSTNLLLSWTPATGDATNYAILRGIYNPTNYAYNYTQITNVSPATTNLKFFGALTNDSGWTVAYEIEAVYPGGGIATPITTLPDYYTTFTSINVGANTNAPAAPGNFYGYPDSTGTNIFLSWSPVSGAVTNYLVYGGVRDATTGLTIYHRLARLGAATNSLAVIGAVDGSGNNLYSIYNVVAVYTNNSLSQSASWNPGNGAPAPGTLYAWLDSTGTNVQLSWTAATGGSTGYLVERSDDYGYYPYQIGQVGFSTTALTDVDAVNTGYFDPSSTVYQVQAMYPNGGLSLAVTATINTNPPAPSNLSATVDSTGANVMLTWTPAVGAVTGYTILRGTYNQSTGQFSYSQIGTTAAGVTSFQDTGAITSNNSYNNVYKVVANYSGGILSSPALSSLFQSATPPAAPNLNVTAQLVRNPTGRWQLMFSGVTTNMQAIALDWYYWDYWYDIGPFPYPGLGYPFSVETDIPVSSLTNGVYVIPDNMLISALLLGNVDGNFSGWTVEIGVAVMVQPIMTNGAYGNQITAGFLPNDQPAFADGRQCLKQNLLFALRAAGISQPNAALGVPVDTNYVESSIYHWTSMDKGYNSGYATFLAKDDLWPFEANYSLHPNLYDPNYTGPASFTWQGNLLTTPAPAVLGVSDPYWISQPISISSSGNSIDPATGLPITPYYNISISPDTAAYTNGSSLYLQSGAHNLFGLAFQAALVNAGSMATLSPGGSIAATNVNCYYSQTADPGLQLVNYYFAPVNTPGTSLPNENPQIQPAPIPTLTGFANTNQTGMLVTSVGTPILIGGWAKFAITNGSSSKFAYLGQYFVTNALVVTNGIVTTNKTGIVSPYGDFFPTQPGMDAMITMPDIDTGAQGTGIVRVVALNVDANHDGTMDFTYQGPDFASQSKPFRFWVNDNHDAFDDFGDGIPQDEPWYITDGFSSAGTTPYSTLPMLPPVPGGFVVEPFYRVHGTRDLVDYFPVYLNIGSLFQSNALSAGISITDTNYYFILSQADSVLRFVYTDLTPTNYMNFLRATNEAESLAAAVALPIDARGVPLSQSFVAGIATNNQGIILVEAATNTTQPLVLTIYHGTNQIAQTSLYLSISGVEQMFRHKNLLLNPDSRAPAERLSDASVPNEPDTIGKNFIFVHGYNVNPDQARGWDADFYKRMYWSGSHTKFWAVTWEAADTQVAGQVTINLQTNIVNAFNTAPLLNTFLNSLSGTNIVAAHSLGNMLVLSALNDYTNRSINSYFMIDAAVPMEALEGYQGQTAPMLVGMIHSEWIPYANKLYASDWRQLFSTNDVRSTLTWSNRLSNLQNADVYNFYSSGEEVLRATTSNPPTNLLSAIKTIAYDYLVNNPPLASYMWVWQEKGKGRCASDGLLSSSHGGWKFNSTYDTNGAHMDTSQASLLPNVQLSTNAFFDVTSSSFGTADLALYGSGGSAYAQLHRNRILSDAIPSLTLPVGANAVTNLDIEFGDKRNYDMQGELENGWPAARPKLQVGNSAAGEWHHSDCRQIAYPFTHNLFDDMVTLGNLK